MKAIINCGGKGTRLPEISKIMPKPMVEINDKPLLYWTIRNLKKYGITEICITVHYLSKKIVDYFGDGKKFGVHIIYSFEEQLLGTGGALVPIKNFLTENTLLVYGDVMTEINYEKLLSFHKKNHAIITTVVHKSSHPEDSDLVQFDKNNKLTKLLKKPHFTISNKPYNLAAVYVLSPKVVSFLTHTLPFSFEHHLIPAVFKKNGHIFCYNTDELLMDIGTPARLKKAKKLLSV